MYIRMLQCLRRLQKISCSMSLDEVISDVEWEPTMMEILTPEISLVVKAEAEKEDPVVPEPVPDWEPEKEKN